MCRAGPPAEQVGTPGGASALVRCSLGFTPDDPRQGPRTPARESTDGTGAGPSPRNGRLYTRTLGSLPVQSPAPWGPRSHLQALGSGTPRPPVYPGPLR